MCLEITGTWCIASAKSHHLTYLLHHLLYPVLNKSNTNVALSCPTWNTHTIFWKRHLKRLHIRDRYNPVLVNSKRGQLSTSCCRDSGGAALCCFKSADRDVILTGAEPGEVFGSDTLRSYYFPPSLLLLWLSRALKIALGQYRIPTVTMLIIKNSWTFNVKHDRGQWGNTGLGHMCWEPL